MSKLQALNGSKLGAVAGSQLQVFGLGFKTYEELYHDDVVMDWDVELYLNNVTQNTISYIGKGGIIFGPYFVTCHAMGITDLGKNEIGPWDAYAYNGTPNPLTDTISSNSLILNPNNVTGSSFWYTGWGAYGSLTSKPFWENTGSSMIFRSEVFMRASAPTYVSSAEGLLHYGPWMNLAFDGNWVRVSSLEWIMWYLTGFSGQSIGWPSGQDRIRILARIQVEVTA